MCVVVLFLVEMISLLILVRLDLLKGANWRITLKLSFMFLECSPVFSISLGYITV